MVRPLIGITSYAQPAKWGAWALPAALVPYYYVESVERAGGRALVVPPSTEAIDETLDVLDGVVFGGIDLDPATCTGPSGTSRPTPRRSIATRGRWRSSGALARDIPTLAICRGFQLLNVVRGGDLLSTCPRPSGTRGTARCSAPSPSIPWT